MTFRPLLAPLAAAALACLSAVATAASQGEWQVSLLRSSTTVSPVSKGATAEAAWAACIARIPASAAASVTYTCQTPRYVATVAPDPCPAQPPLETRPGACPAGTVGTWSQSRSYVSSPAPACWTAGPWAPDTAPAGTCSTPPPPPTCDPAKRPPDELQAQACPNTDTKWWNQTRTYACVGTTWTASPWVPTAPTPEECAVAPPPPPVTGALQYSDLDSVPVGGFVTVWGQGLGTAGKVMVGGTEATVLSWSDSMIEFKVLAAGSGVEVSRPDGLIIGTLPLVARTTGRVLYADPVNGKNTCDGSSPVVVSATVCPFKDQGSNGNATSPNRVAAGFYALKPGDVLYLRGGTYPNATDTYGGKTWLFLDGERSGITAPNVGAPGLPIAMTVYPGETADVGSDTFGVGVMPYGDIHDITLAKFRLHSGSAAMSQNTSKNARIRLVGITTAGPMNDTYNAFGLVGTDDLKVFGLTITNVGKPGEKLSHAIYYEGYGSSTRVEIAWNHIKNERGGRGIQVYAHQAVDHIDTLLIHDNVVDTTTLSGILVGQGDGGAPANWITRAEITDNLVRRSGNPNAYTSNGYLPEQSALHISLPGCDFLIRNNTLTGDNVYHTLWLERAKSAVIENNLFESKSLVLGFTGGAWNHNAFVGLPVIGVGVTAASATYDSAGRATGALAGYGIR